MTARRGLTLLEMLVAIGLLAALVGSMFTFLFDLLAARSRALEYAGWQMASGTLIEQAASDLTTCLVGDQTVGAGVQGQNTRLRVLSRGVAGALAGRGADDPAVFADLLETEYRFDAGSGRIEARRRPVGDAASAAWSFEPLGGPVHEVRFRYHDGSRWLDEFDSLALDRLPAAVEVAVWFVPEDGEGFDEPLPDRFRVIAVPDARPPERGRDQTLAQAP